jgi:hypothetical protein
VHNVTLSVAAVCVCNPELHSYEVRPRKDHRGVDLISDALPSGRLWYGEPNAIGYAMHRSRSHRAASTTVKCVNSVIDLRMRFSYESNRIDIC